MTYTAEIDRESSLLLFDVSDAEGNQFGLFICGYIGLLKT